MPVVRMRGVIGAGNRFRPALSLAAVAGPLGKAFAIKNAPAVAIVVDSPGGSPVQSRLIYKRIRDLAAEHERPVLVFVEDVAASGGYMIACAGDEILCDPSSILGSIGVISASFGFVEAIEKLGIERRVYTAGENKLVLDPFRPEQEGDVQHLKSIQEQVHETFIDLVKERRGALLADDPEIFSGRFWEGRRSVTLGLADGLGELRSTLRARFGDTVRLKLMTVDRSLFGRTRPGLSSSLGHAVVDALAGELEERAQRARYGL